MIHTWINKSIFFFLNGFLIVLSIYRLNIIVSKSRFRISSKYSRNVSSSVSQEQLTVYKIPLIKNLQNIMNTQVVHQSWSGHWPLQLWCTTWHGISQSIDDLMVYFDKVWHCIRFFAEYYIGNKICRHIKWVILCTYNVNINLKTNCSSSSEILDT